MTENGTKARLLGMYLKKYNLYGAIGGDDGHIMYDTLETTESVLVCMLVSGKFVKIRLSKHAGGCNCSDRYACLNSHESNDDKILKKITHFPIKKHYFDLRAINSFEDTFVCDFFEISRLGLSNTNGNLCGTKGYYRINEASFINENFLKNAPLEAIKRLISMDFLIHNLAVCCKTEILNCLCDKGCSLTQDYMNESFEENMRTILCRYGHVKIVKWTEHK